MQSTKPQLLSLPFCLALRALVVVCIVGGGLAKGDAAETPFPAKPIKLIVYMKPAGLIDVMARRFVAVAARHAPDATFVVENKHGAGGIVAMRKVQRQKADGYTLFACTKSNVSKAVSCDVESYLTNFHWLAYLMADSECVITHRESDVSTWSQLAADAIAKPNEQLWLGPENGGLDHVTALKIWEAAGMTAKWIPCSSGAEARGKLLGQQGVAYVGNPRETLGHPNLTIAAVCSHQRLPQFPDAPTFRELGIDGLENENMWRGIAIKKGAPIHAIAWYEDLFQRVSADPEWRSFWEKGGIHVQFQPHDQFSKIVEQDRQSFRRHLTEIGLVRESTGTTSWMFSPWLAVAVMITTVMGTIMVGRRAPAGVPIVGGLVLGIAITLLCHTFAFPASSSVGPAVIPRLYVAAVGLVVVLLMCERHKTASEDPAQDSGNTPFGAAEFIFSMIAYWFAVVFFGYAIATALFLGVTLFRLGVRRPFTIVSVAVCWIAASYVVFVKVLYVPLPTGFLWESF